MCPSLCILITHRALARAIYDKRCRLLLLDEASSSVDCLSEMLLARLLRSSLLAALTVLVIAHRPATIQVCVTLVCLFYFC